MIGVTGATGQLGRLVMDGLLEKGVPAGELVAVVRSPDRASRWAEQGVQVRKADYEEPDTLPPALKGVEKLLLISASEVGRRAAQHRNVVDAAVAEGVELLAYTSILNVETSRMELAQAHQETEQLIGESGLPFVFLRNGWYLENYTAQIPTYIEHGAVLGSAGDGQVSGASRTDYADAAVAVLTGDVLDHAVYELGGDEPFTLPELARELSRQSGKEVEYRDLPEEAYAEALIAAGLPEALARALADADRGIARSELYTERQDLRDLIGRPAKSLSEAIAAAL